MLRLLNARTYPISPNQTEIFPSQEARLRDIAICFITSHLFRAGLHPLAWPYQEADPRDPRVRCLGNTS